VDQMLQSLDAHRSQVTVMEEKDIALLREWRDTCMIDTHTMVAYFRDY